MIKVLASPAATRKDIRDAMQAGNPGRIISLRYEKQDSGKYRLLYGIISLSGVAHTVTRENMPIPLRTLKDNTKQVFQTAMTRVSSLYSHEDFDFKKVKYVDPQDEENQRRAAADRADLQRMYREATRGN